MDSEIGQGAGRSSWLRTNQGVGVLIGIVVVVLLIYLGMQDWVYEELRDGFHLGTFTVVSAVAILACAIAMALDSDKDVVEEELAEARPIEFVYAIIIVVTAYVYYQLAWKVDFLLVTPVFLCGGMFVLGVRPFWVAAVAGVVTTVVIFSLFHLIGLDLPSFLTPA